MSADPYRYFRIEARDLTDQIARGALELERGAAAREQIPTLMRLTHTLKGAARVVRLPDIATRAHAIEDLLAPHRGSDAPVDAAALAQLRVLIDEIDAMVRAVSAPIAGSPAGPPAAGHPPAGQPPAGDLSARHPSVRDPDAGAPPGGQPSAGRPAIGRPGAEPTRKLEELERIVRAGAAEVDALADGLDAALARVAALADARGLSDSVRRIADSLGRTGGVAPALAQLEQLRVGAGEIEDGIAHLGRELSELRQAAERLRLVPAAVLLEAVERAARDAATSARRAVDVVIECGDIRLDAATVGPVQAALVQAARNAIAHGVEPEAERSAAGKPARARVTLRVIRRGDRLAFSCEDDGRGIDLDEVRRRATRAGLLPAGAAPSDDDLLALLMRGGISTSRSVTDLAGRGVGLDVVREAASKLGGEVALRTRRARGTTIELVVPAVATGMDVLLVESGEQTWALPLDAVAETRRVEARDVTHGGDGAWIAHGATPLRFAGLAQCVVAGRRSSGTGGSAVLVRAEGELVAVAVDRVLGTSSLVVRPIPELAPIDPVVAGAGLDPTGMPVLVLDPTELGASVRRTRAVHAKPVARRPVLVVDDSLTTRMLEQTILESAGFLVETATSGEEALQKIAATRYAAFLVDVEMPGIDGFTVVEAIRADAHHRDVPAILVTSRDAPEDRARGARAGAQGYVVKAEFDQTALLARLRELMRS